MAIEISAQDRDRIIRDLAAAGKPAPAWVKDDPAHLALFDQARAAAADPTAKTARPAAASSAGRATPAKPKIAAAQSKRSRSTRAASGTRRAQRAVSAVAHPAGPTPAPATVPAIRQATGGIAATGGGLLLAIFTYPIALALFQHGPAGFGMWLRAKFLNIGSDRPPATGTGLEFGGAAGASRSGQSPAAQVAGVTPEPWGPGFTTAAQAQAQPSGLAPHGRQVS